MNGNRNINRRKFLACSGTLFASAATAAPLSFSQTAPRKQPRFIFDSHLHCPAEIGELWQWRKVTRNFDDFVAYLDRTGVQRGIINSQRCQENGVPAEFTAGNREVARYVEKYKGRFLGACIVNPLFIDEALRELEECRKRYGFIWLGELCNYMKPSYDYKNKQFDMLVEQATKLGMIISLHTEGDEMEYVAGKFPNATIVFAHFGDDQEGAHIFKRIDTVARHPNCYLDTSGYGHDRVGVLEHAVKTIGPDRILFGSDFTINDPSTVIARIENAFLPEDEKRKIFAENLEGLLRKHPV